MYYIGAPDGLAAIYVKPQSGAASMYYAHTDHLGSIVSLTDSAGVAVFKASYDAWGKQTVSLNTIGFHRGYTGHEHLPEFGLINMNGRMYDPVLGRFLSPDNYVQAADFSQSYNRYSYCINNPLSYTDPSGEFWHIVIGAAVGGVINLATNWDNIDGFWEGAAAFGVGAGAGALTAATGGATAGTFMASTGAAVGAAVLGGSSIAATNNLISQTGKNFSGAIDWGQVGFSSLVGGVSGLAGYGAGQWASNHIGSAMVGSLQVKSPMISQGIKGMVGGAFGGAAGGFTGGFLFSGGDLKAGLQGARSGFTTGAAIGAGVGLGSGFLYAKQNNLNIWNGKSLTPKYDFTPDTYGDNITMYRGTTGSEGNGGPLFMTDNPEYAATYVKNGGTVVSATIPRSTYMQMYHNGHIQSYHGMHGGSYGYEYQIHPSVVTNFLQLFK